MAGVEAVAGVAALAGVAAVAGVPQSSIDANAAIKVENPFTASSWGKHGRCARINQTGPTPD